MKVRDGKTFIRKGKKNDTFDKKKKEVRHPANCCFLIYVWETHTRSEATSGNLYVQIKEVSLAVLFINRLRLCLTVTFNYVSKLRAIVFTLCFSYG